MIKKIAREGYQIDIGPGDAIPGVSPHLGRLGIGYQPNQRLIYLLIRSIIHNSFTEELETMLKE